MNEYILVRALVGAVAMGAIISTGLVFLLLSGFSKKWKHIMLLQLSGAVLIALGFSGANFDVTKGEILPTFMVMTGTVLISLPFLTNKSMIFSRSLILKSALILASPAALYLINEVTITGILRIFTLISLLFLINTLASIRMISSYMRFTLNAASWLLVLYSWVGYLSHRLPLCYSYVLLLIYYSALLLWLFGAVVMLINLRGWLGWNA